MPFFMILAVIIAVIGGGSFFFLFLYNRSYHIQLFMWFVPVVLLALAVVFGKLSTLQVEAQKEKKKAMEVAEEYKALIEANDPKKYTLLAENLEVPEASIVLEKKKNVFFATVPAGVYECYFSYNKRGEVTGIKELRLRRH